MKKYISAMVAMVAMVLLTGCGSAGYYKAVQENNKAYLKEYNNVENERVNFEGTFEGKIEIVKPKDLPDIQFVQKPKDAGDYFLQTLGILAPVGLGVAGYHYNYKSTDSSNKYNAQTMEAWTGNFQNSTTTSITTNNDTIKETQTLPSVFIDSNSTSIGN